MNSCWAEFSPTGLQKGSTYARPRPRCRFCAESPDDLKFFTEPLPLFLCLANTCRNTPALSLFTIPSPRRRTTGNRAPVSLYRPIHSMTDVLLWQRLNSSPDERCGFPGRVPFTNCTPVKSSELLMSGEPPPNNSGLLPMVCR